MQTLILFITENLRFECSLDIRKKKKKKSWLINLHARPFRELWCNTLCCKWHVCCTAIQMFLAAVLSLTMLAMFSQQAHLRLASGKSYWRKKAIGSHSRPDVEVKKLILKKWWPYDHLRDYDALMSSQFRDRGTLQEPSDRSKTNSTVITSTWLS